MTAPKVCDATLRDYFAASALQGMLAAGDFSGYAPGAASQAYDLAAAMLAERARREVATEAEPTPVAAPIPGIPRRCRYDLYTPAERAISDAVQAVEAAGADVRLTDAVILLQKAKDRVADFVEGTGSSEPVLSPEPDR